VVVPLNVLLRGCEIAYYLADSGAKSHFCFQGGPELPIGHETLLGRARRGAGQRWGHGSWPAQARGTGLNV
jgi:hypothetical protein